MPDRTRNKIMLFLSSLLLSLLYLVSVATAYLDGKIIDLALAGDLVGVSKTALFNAGILVLRFAFFVVSILIHMKYVSGGTLTLKHNLMKNILSRPLRIFRLKNNAYYLNLMGADVDMYRQDRLNCLPYLPSEGIVALASAAALYFINPWLCLAGVVMAVIPILLSNLIQKSTQKRRKAYSEANEAYTSTLKETIEGYEAIRMENASVPALTRFDQASAVQQRAFTANKFTMGVGHNAMWFVGSALQLSGIVLGGYFIVKGQLTAGLLASATYYFAGIIDGTNNFIEYLINIRSTKPVAKKLLAEAEAPCPKESGGELAAEPLIEYEHVSFGFGERELYHDFSHAFLPGGCYAVTGESGGGKSTLIKLLLKYYDDYTGEIRLAGQNIRGLCEEEIYGLVSVVSQTAFLFNASLYENITLYSGEPKEDSEEYRALLRDVNLTALAARVGSAPLGDFGDNISGGERQRICIARAMRRKPRVMIFDEPTTGLDPENVAIINEFIFRHKDITRIVISHDWSREYLDRFDGVIRLGEPG